MDKRRIYRRSPLLLCVAVLVAVSATVVLMKPRLYYGKTVDDWVHQLCRARVYGTSANAHDRLVEIGPPAVNRLIEALDEDEPKSSLLYRKLWLKLPDGLRRILPRPRSPELGDKRLVFQVLTSIGSPSEKVVAAIRRGATNQDSEMRFAAVSSLRNLSATNTYLFLPILTNALKDSAHNVRGSAIAVLGTWGSRATSAIPALIQCLADQSSHCRMHAARTLERMGEDSPPVINALTKALDDSDNSTRVVAARALYRLTGRVEPSLKVIEEVLRGDDSGSRQRALAEASALGTNAVGLVPFVRTFSRSEGIPMQISVADFLWKVAGDSASSLSFLSDVMLSKERSNQLPAAKLLAAMGSEAEPAIPALITVLSTNNDWLVQQFTVEALEAMGTNATPALPVLTNLLNHRVTRVRDAANSAIRAISSGNRNRMEPVRR